MSPEHEFTIVVEKATALSAADALEALTDWERYPAWWPIHCARHPREPRGLIVAPAPFVRLLLLHEPTAEERIRFVYARGPFRGTGVWAVEGNETALVRYTVRLRPAHIGARWVSSTKLFRSKHTRDIERIIGRLPGS